MTARGLDPSSFVAQSVFFMPCGKPQGTVAGMEGRSLGVFLFYDSVELLKAIFMDFDLDVPFLTFVRELVTVIAYDFAFFLLFEVFPVFLSVRIFSFSKRAWFPVSQFFRMRPYITCGIYFFYVIVMAEEPVEHLG